MHHNNDCNEPMNDGFVGADSYVMPSEFRMENLDCCGGIEEFDCGGEQQVIRHNHVVKHRRDIINEYDVCHEYDINYYDVVRHRDVVRHNDFTRHQPDYCGCNCGSCERCSMPMPRRAYRNRGARRRFW